MKLIRPENWHLQLKFQKIIVSNNLIIKDKDIDLISWKLSNRSWFSLPDNDLGRKKSDIFHITQKRSFEEPFDSEITLHLFI